MASASCGVRAGAARQPAQANCAKEEMQVVMQDGNGIRTTPCPECFLCALQGEARYEGLRDHVAGAPGTWRMRRCANPECGLLWLDPKPVEGDLLKAYAQYHTHGTEHGGARASALSKALNSACRLASRLGDQFTGLAAQRRQLRKMFLGAERPGRLLEIGCGGGRFLNRMRKSGWEVEGIDFDPKAADRVAARYGIRVACGALADQQYTADSFDAVAMSQVIEHVYDPQALLQECRRVLAPGGRLVVTTPNARSQAHAMFGRCWRGLEPPRHMQIFTPSALARCARNAGFLAVQVQTLSAESAGIYRASEEIRMAESQGVPAPSAASRIVRSWVRQHEEFVRARQQPDLGEDILMIALKPSSDVIRE
jgi:SAM-dependent methyltransferase